MTKIFKILTVVLILLNTSCKVTLLKNPLLGDEDINLSENPLVGTWVIEENDYETKLEIKNYEIEHGLFLIEVSNNKDVFSAQFNLGKQAELYFLNIVDKSIKFNKTPLYGDNDQDIHYLVWGAKIEGGTLVIMPSNLTRFSERFTPHIKRKFDVKRKLDDEIIRLPLMKLFAQKSEVIELVENRQMYEELSKEYSNIFENDDRLIFTRTDN